MKKIILIIVGLLCSSTLLAQRKTKLLEIYSITEYLDGYVIRAVDKTKADTINIVSTKTTNRHNKHFVKMAVGNQYTFEFEDRISQMAAMPPKNFVIRIKRTVVWKNGDGISNIPVFATNTQNLWIKK